MYYETQIMDVDEARKFKEWFDKEIGTECERHKLSEGEYYFVCYPLEYDEIAACRSYENKK